MDDPTSPAPDAAPPRLAWIGLRRAALFMTAPLIGMILARLGVMAGLVTSRLPSFAEYVRYAGEWSWFEVTEIVMSLGVVGVGLGLEWTRRRTERVPHVLVVLTLSVVAYLVTALAALFVVGDGSPYLVHALASLGAAIGSLPSEKMAWRPPSRRVGVAVTWSFLAVALAVIWNIQPSSSYPVDAKLDARVAWVTQNWPGAFEEARTRALRSRHVRDALGGEPEVIAPHRERISYRERNSLDPTILYSRLWLTAQRGSEVLDCRLEANGDTYDLSAFEREVARKDGLELGPPRELEVRVDEEAKHATVSHDDWTAVITSPKADLADLKVTLRPSGSAHVGEVLMGLLSVRSRADGTPLRYTLELRSPRLGESDSFAVISRDNDGVGSLRILSRRTFDEGKLEVRARPHEDVMVVKQPSNDELTRSEAGWFECFEGPRWRSVEHELDEFGHLIRLTASPGADVEVMTRRWGRSSLDAALDRVRAFEELGRRVGDDAEVALAGRAWRGAKRRRGPVEHELYAWGPLEPGCHSCTLYVEVRGDVGEGLCAVELGLCGPSCEDAQASPSEYDPQLTSCSIAGERVRFDKHGRGFSTACTLQCDDDRPYKQEECLRACRDTERGVPPKDGAPKEE